MVIIESKPPSILHLTLHYFHFYASRCAIRLLILTPQPQILHHRSQHPRTNIQRRLAQALLRIISGTTSGPRQTEVLDPLETLAAFAIPGAAVEREVVGAVTPLSSRSTHLLEASGPGNGLLSRKIWNQHGG